MIGALSGDFAPEASCGSTNGVAIRCRQSIGASAFCFRTRYCSTISASGKFTQLALPENVRGEARKTAVEKRLAAPGWRASPARSGHALRRAAARVSLRALLARPERSMSPSAARMPACAPGSAAGSLKNWPAGYSGDHGDPRSRGCPPTGRCWRWSAGNEGQ